MAEFGVVFCSSILTFRNHTEVHEQREGGRKMKTGYIQDLIAFISSDKVFPEIKVISGSSTDPEVVAGGKRVLLFCSPNYLGLSNNPEVNSAAKMAIDEYGIGTNGSGIVSGYIDLYRDLEKELAQMMGAESAIFYNSVSQASMGVITSIMDPPLKSLYEGELKTRAMISGKTRAVFMDRENHASLLDAVKLCHVDKTSVYPNCDMEELERQLKRSTADIKFILTDGYFSMDARLAPLPEILSLAKEYSAVVFIDDAHSTGVLGPNGLGSLEHYGLSDENCFVVGSLSKAIGVRGGFTYGDADYIKYLRGSSRGYVFSGTLSAAIPAACMTSLKIARVENWRRTKVLENAEYLRSGLKALGLNAMGELHIVPWFIGSEEKTIAVSNDLFNEFGIFAPPIRFPAVKRGLARVRFIPMATHTKEHLDRVLEACAVTSKRYGLVP